MKLLARWIVTSHEAVLYWGGGMTTSFVHAFWLPQEPTGAAYWGIYRVLKNKIKGCGVII